MKKSYIHPYNLRGQCVFDLSAMDCLQSGIPPIAFSLFYDQPIDVIKLQEAVQHSLVHFPILAGRIHRSSNRKVAPLRVVVHPLKGGALFVTQTIKKAYKDKDDRRWFPIFTGAPWPAPHEPHITDGPLLKIKHTLVAGTNSSVLSFGFCHAVMDATTVGSFLTTLKAHYNADTPSAVMLNPEDTMSLERLNPRFEEGPLTEPLDRFTKGDLCRNLPALIHGSTSMKHVNLTVAKKELARLKEEFLNALEGELEWVSTYEMMGVVLLRSFYKASKEELAGAKTKELECRCVVDPRGRDANPYVQSFHQGNVGELPSIRLAYDKLDQQKSWQKLSLQEFHEQLRATLKDSDKMTHILRRAQTSYDQGHLHTKEGRILASKVFARNMLEANVCTYNSWLHLDWFGMTTFGNGETAQPAKPLHMQVTKGMSCKDMFWLFPKSPTEITIRATLPPAKVDAFLEELGGVMAFEVQ